MFFGVINLETPIFLRGDALQYEYETEIGAHTVTLIFPGLPEGIPSEETWALVPPALDFLSDTIEWGYIIEGSKQAFTPETTSTFVKTILIRWKDEEFENSCEEILQGIDNWRKLLAATICLKQKFSFSRVGVTSKKRGGISLFNADSRTEYDCHPSTHITLVFSDIEHAITPTQLQDILQLIVPQKPLKLEYELLLEAYKERAENNNRYALIQAISAVEVCINNKIDAICKAKGINSGRLLNRRTLGDKFDLLRALEIEWATADPNSEITRFRNNLFHTRTLIPTPLEVDTVILAIECYLELYSPDYFIEDS